MSTAASPQCSEAFTGGVVVMGVANCGKTTIGRALADRLGLRFIEGDALHSPDSIAKMSRGEPLTDDGRWSWLAPVGESLRGEDGVVASCSALKRRYREAIAQAAQRPVLLIHLHGAREALADRISSREGHFMPASLLNSQLATLEIPGVDEPAITLDIEDTPDNIVAAAAAFLRKGYIHAP